MWFFGFSYLRLMILHEILHQYQSTTVFEGSLKTAPYSPLFPPLFWFPLLHGILWIFNPSTHPPHGIFIWELAIKNRN